MLNFIEELRWRGMLQDFTPGVKARMAERPIVGYIGFDPTAPSLTIGNFVQIMLLRLLQLSGHRPIVLMGGATGRIGDPSGKDKERELKSYDELDRNLSFQQQQFSKFLDFDGPYAAQVVNNYDFYKDMNVLDFLRDVGKTLTVSYMTSKESVKRRVETGLSFTEFSYQLLQAYDFQRLYQTYDCELQMGGSDQWGNITSGTEFIRRNTGGKAYAVTTPLLTKSDGSKFGKSEQGNIWLDPEMTSPYAFYQFWINADDRDLSKFLRYFTLRPQAEVMDIERVHADNPRQLKQLLAEELTERVHGADDLASVKKVTQLLYGKTRRDDVLSLSVNDLRIVAAEIPTYDVAAERLVGGVPITELLTEVAPILSSNGDVRRAVKNNALAVNKQKITSHDHWVTDADLLHSKYLLVENGKKNKYVLRVPD